MPNAEGRCTQWSFSHCQSVQVLILKYIMGAFPRLTVHFFFPLPPPECHLLASFGRDRSLFTDLSWLSAAPPRPSSNRKELCDGWLPASPSTLSNPEWRNEELIYRAGSFVQWTWDETKSKKITFAVIKQAVCLCQRLRSFILIRLAVDPTPTPDLPPDWFFSLSICPLIPFWDPPFHARFL